jgi:hypothetical protein
MGVRLDVAAAFAQYVWVPARNIVVLPPAMPIEYGGLIDPLAVAVHAVRRSGAKPDDVVVVLGGGPIGQFDLLALKMVGVDRIVVSELSPKRRDLVERFGVAAIERSAEAVETAVQRLFSRPANMAIDAVGVARTLAAALRSTHLGATICLVGMGSRALEFDAFRVSTEERSIVGSFTYSNDDFATAAVDRGCPRGADHAHQQGGFPGGCRRELRGLGGRRWHSWQSARAVGRGRWAVADPTLCRGARMTEFLRVGATGSEIPVIGTAGGVCHLRPTVPDIEGSFLAADELRLAP